MSDFPLEDKLPEKMGKQLKNFSEEVRLDQFWRSNRWLVGWMISLLV